MFKNAIFLSAFLITLAMVFNDCARKGARHITSVKWRKTGALPPSTTEASHPGLAGALAGLHNNVLIIGGGANFPDSMPWRGGKKQYHDAVYVFRKGGNGYELMEGPRRVLPFPVAYGASCSTPEGVLYAGGETERGPVSTVTLVRYDSRSNEIAVTRLADLPYPIANGSIAADGTRIYLAGGETVDGASRNLLGFDLLRPEAGWSIVTDLPYAVSHAVLATAGDQAHRYLYLIGGRKRAASGISDFFSSNVRLDLETNRWYQRAPLPYGVSAGTGYSTGSEIVLFGGDRGETFRTTEALLVEISNESDSEKRDSLKARKDHIQENHPGFSREILKYSVDDDKWIPVGRIPFETPVTTTAVRSGDADVVIPSGEIRAGVRTPLIMEGTLTFDSKEKQ